MKVRRRGPTSAAHRAQGLSRLDFLTDMNVDMTQVSVTGHVPIRMPQRNHFSVTVIPVGVNHDTRAGSQNFIPPTPVALKIDSGVKIAAPGPEMRNDDRVAQRK